MALVLADRVQETTNTTGTGTLTLAGAVSGYQSFGAIGNTNTTYYTIVSGTDWEVGIGTYTSAGTTLSRDTVFSSSAGGTTKISVAAGAVVFGDYPATIATPANITSYTTTATAAGTTVLTSTSSFQQFFTGTSTQTVTLPVSSTLSLGWSYWITNNSTGNITVNSSGGNLVSTVTPQTTVMCTVIDITVNTAAAWDSGIMEFGSATGTGAVVQAVSPAITGAPTIGSSGFTTLLLGNVSSSVAPSNLIAALALTGTPNNAAGGKVGVLQIGSNFTASDKNILASFVQNINDYTQIVVQNPNAGTAASADVVVNNDNTTGSGTFGDFGINSSAFSGTGSFNLANAIYLYSSGGELVLGTQSANGVRFTINNSALDAGSISSAGKWAINNAVANTTATALLHLGAGTATANTAPLKLTTGTNLATAEAGAVEYDGTALYMTPFGTSRGVLPASQLQVLSTTYTLTSQTAAQKLLNATTNGAVAVVPGLYEFECQFMLTGMSATAGTLGFALAGTATYTQQWMSTASRSGTTATTITTGNTNSAYQTNNTAANTAITGSSTNTTGSALIKGFIRVTVAGTVIPQVSMSVASAAVVQTGAYFKITPLSATSTATNIGNWT